MLELNTNVSINENSVVYINKVNCNYVVRFADGSTVNVTQEVYEQLKEYEGGGGTSGGVVKEQYINFYDYDGTLVASWSKEQLDSATTLPELPNHEDENLTNEGWNWTLADIKAEGKETNVGCTYHTSDGWSYFYLHINQSTSVSISFDIDGTYTIDYGDGTTGTDKTHTYTEAGYYTLKLQGTSDITNLLFSSKSLIKVLLSNQITSIANSAFNSCYALQTIIIPDSVVSIGYSAFQYCSSLQNTITLSNTVTSIGSSTFNSCYSLRHIIIPNTVASIGNGAIQTCYGLQSLIIPKDVTSIGNNVFNNCYTLQNIILPTTVTSIGTNVFSNCYALRNIVIPTTVTSIGTNAFSNCRSLQSIDLSQHNTPPTLSSTNAIPTSYPVNILIKKGTKDLYLNATNWKSISANLYIEVTA